MFALRHLLRSNLSVIAMLVICLLTSACGDPRFKKTYAVKGQVLFEGQPAAGAAVSLRPVTTDDHPWTKPSGEVDDKGNFTITSYRKGDGAPAGKYKVAIVWLPPGFAGPLEAGNKLPARYADPETSGIMIEVLAKDTTLPPFQLTK